jgi:hypothetical protein
VKKIALLFSLLIFFKPLIPVMEYIVDYDYIATVLCVNKEKPQMHCNGKCHLMKELARASENEKPQSDKKNLHQEQEVLFCELPVHYNFSTTEIAFVTKNQTGYSNLYSHINSVSIFHPPAFIS